ncbi:hypothetical protein HNP47_000356 [Brevundimonas vesicularis]|uniref:ParB/Sulfiredoxin domain-containing protein n=1 Tax=Brevundimonas vesicularis TaxID=41276 RepID=A0A7W9FRR1_BREVE|nr:hypothetical protein [Brevundimonas vesicularis]MBB5770387.1 hypothetical protein [Brevundimonas vesicularis]
MHIAPHVNRAGVVPMPYENLEIRELLVNQANDRHGELGSEDLAIAELFRLHDAQMRNLAADIAEVGTIYDPPLVMPIDDHYIVFDGNRRITCLKLLLSPERAPTAELRDYFVRLAEEATVQISASVTCQIEHDRNLIDAILYRRHTGSQRGVGQLSWNDRAKLNFVERTGQGGGVNVAAEVERLLSEADRLPCGAIPWSTLTRLLSSEEFRNRAGVSTAGRRFRLTHDPEVVLDALNRITTDLSNQTITLGNLWNNAGKRAYLNSLQDEGVLPAESERLPNPANPGNPDGTGRNPGRNKRPRPPQTNFVPSDAPHIQWIANQQRIRAIWEELQSLQLRSHPNAVSALMRILLELSVENYIAQHNLNAPDNLSRRVGAVSRHLLDHGAIDQDYFDELERIRLNDQLISIASMQRYIHSPEFAPMEHELRTYWIRLGRFLVAALNR